MKIIQKRQPKEPNHSTNKLWEKAKAILPTVGIVLCLFIVLAILETNASSSKYATVGSIKQELAVYDSIGGTYIGPAVNTVYSGDGEFRYLSNGNYIGSFENSKRSGKGNFKWANGDTYDGTWKDDEMSDGTYTFSNGNRYTGTFDKSHFKDGDFFLGDKAAEGLGFHSFQVSLTNGKINSLYYATNSGEKYTGSLTGKATITYANGSTYDGEVVNGKRQGKGIFTWKENGIEVASYDGNWANGQMNGSGAYSYSSYNAPNLIGNFKDGKPEGNLVYNSDNGYAYNTTWSNGTCTSITMK